MNTSNITAILTPSQKQLAAIVAVIASAITLSTSTAASTHIENCKHNGYGDYVCVWTENESHFEFGARVMIDGKPASHQRVSAQVTTNGVAGYICETATTERAFCKFGQSAAEIYSIRVNVAGVEFAWHDGSWR